MCTSQCCFARLCAALQVFGANVIPDSTCSKQWSLSLDLDVPASALEAPSDSSTRLTQLLKVYAGDGTALSGAAALGWPTVHLRVSQAAATLLVQWGDGAANSREQMVRLSAGHNHLAIVRDKDRLGRRAVAGSASRMQHKQQLHSLSLAVMFSA